jgi:hypothetical protein
VLRRGKGREEGFHGGKLLEEGKCSSNSCNQSLFLFFFFSFFFLKEGRKGRGQCLKSGEKEEKVEGLKVSCRNSVL